MSAIGSVKLNLVKRAQNSVAHELSQYARLMNSMVVWLAGVPPCFSSTSCSKIVPRYDLINLAPFTSQKKDVIARNMRSATKTLNDHRIDVTFSLT